MLQTRVKKPLVQRENLEGGRKEGKRTKENKRGREKDKRQTEKNGKQNNKFGRTRLEYAFP